MRTEFVGRERELRALAAALADARAGRPRLVLCHGELGIGKTRLVEEFLARAGEAGRAAGRRAGHGAVGRPGPAARTEYFGGRRAVHGPLPSSVVNTTVGIAQGLLAALSAAAGLVARARSGPSTS